MQAEKKDEREREKGGEREKEREREKEGGEREREREKGRERRGERRGKERLRGGREKGKGKREGGRGGGEKGRGGGGEGKEKEAGSMAGGALRGEWRPWDWEFAESRSVLRRVVTGRGDLPGLGRPPSRRGGRAQDQGMPMGTDRWRQAGSGS